MANNNLYEKYYVIPNHRSLGYIVNNKATFHISEGTVRSGKTTDNISKFATIVEESPDMLFLAIGQTQPTAKTILFDGDGLGLEHYPDWQEKRFKIGNKIVIRRSRIRAGKYKGNDALILDPIKNSGKPRKYIVAFGGMNADSHTKYKGWSVGAFIATQWELLHELTRSELIKRTIASRYRKHIIDLNPTAPEHQIYAEFERWEKESTVNYIHKTLKDNPILTDERIKEIMAEYDPESIDFQRDILGLRVSAEGLIYRVRNYNIISEFDPNNYYQYVISADPGVNHSATSFVLVAITHDRKNIDVLKSYYHKNDDKEGLAIKMPTDYALDYIEFIKASMQMMGKAPMDVLSDLDVTFIREFERIKYVSKLGGINLNKTFKKDKIHDRIKMGINLLWKERLRFYNGCGEVIKAYKVAKYNEKEKDKGNYIRYDNPSEQTMIDPIDSVEYAITRLRYEIDRWVG